MSWERYSASEVGYEQHQEPKGTTMISRSEESALLTSKTKQIALKKFGRLAEAERVSERSARNREASSTDFLFNTI